MAEATEARDYRGSRNQQAGRPVNDKEKYMRKEKPEKAAWVERKRDLDEENGSLTRVGAGKGGPGW